MQYIKDTAKEAAEQTGNLIRAETKGDLLQIKIEMKSELNDIMRNSLQTELDKHFGDMSPSQHMIQHSQIDSHMKTLRDVKKEWVKRLISGAVVIAVSAATSVWTASTAKVDTPVTPPTKQTHVKVDKAPPTEPKL